MNDGEGETRGSRHFIADLGMARRRKNVKRDGTCTITWDAQLGHLGGPSFKLNDALLRSLRSARCSFDTRFSWEYLKLSHTVFLTLSLQRRHVRSRCICTGLQERLGYLMDASIRHTMA